MPGADDRELVVETFEKCIWPNGGPTLDDAWLGIYQTLLYYEHGVPHVCESNALTRNAWRVRAERAEEFLASKLGIAPPDVQNAVDRMMKLPRWEGKQRHNPLGHGFRTLVTHILKTWGERPDLAYEQEKHARDIFPGITLPGRSEDPQIDITALRDQSGITKARAVISCKWSSRHDRTSDPTNECPAYKNAAMSQAAHPFRYVVATAENNASRVAKLLDQHCVDYVVHASARFFEVVGDARCDEILAHPRFIDLADFARMTTTTTAW